MRTPTPSPPSASSWFATSVPTRIPPSFPWMGSSTDPSASPTFTLPPRASARSGPRPSRRRASRSSSSRRTTSGRTMTSTGREPTNSASSASSGRPPSRTSRAIRSTASSFASDTYRRQSQRSMLLLPLRPRRVAKRRRRTATLAMIRPPPALSPLRRSPTLSMLFVFVASSRASLAMVFLARIPSIGCLAFGPRVSTFSSPIPKIPRDCAISSSTSTEPWLVPMRSQSPESMLVGFM
mmetsp:Transcript_31653/g.92816  ORF Transcript_31653/g.92816 Transcript_31653/m.92816 type:complete len:238 (+) Transcript_31653:1071-1784(+)